MRAGVIIVSGVLLLAGCGGESDEDQVRSVVETYVTAIADGDGARACEQLTGNAVERIKDEASDAGGGATCESVITSLGEALDADEKNQLKSVEIGETTVDGDTATVRRTGGEPVTLVKTDDGWRIDGGA